ncbi:DUF5320 domain-containing protein [Nanoarchaeota archaeon]
MNIYSLLGYESIFITQDEQIRVRRMIKMPEGDKTGPDGKGPKTGRKLGYCEGNEKPGYENETPRMGMNRCVKRGLGRGRGPRSQMRNRGN